MPGYTLLYNYIIKKSIDFQKKVPKPACFVTLFMNKYAKFVLFSKIFLIFPRSGCARGGKRRAQGVGVGAV